MDVVEVLAKYPLVFGVVYLEAAVFWDAVKSEIELV